MNQGNQSRLPYFFMEPAKQTEAVTFIRSLLKQRNLDIPSHNMTLPDNQHWVIFEHKNRQIGVDSASGVWIRELEGEWRCLAMPCTTSGAIQAIEFLINEKARPNLPICKDQA